MDTEMADNLDLREYARRHRLRVRNLSDGGPVPPVRRRLRGCGRQAFRHPEDRQDAIICHDGYVDIYGPGQVGWCVLVESARTRNNRLRALVALGAITTQAGATEAAGWAPVNLLDEVLKALRPYRRKRSVRGAPRPAPHSTQTASHYPRAPPNRNRAMGCP
jgi:hypothetical protein